MAANTGAVVDNEAEVGHGQKAEATNASPAPWIQAKELAQVSGTRFTTWYFLSHRFIKHETLSRQLLNFWTKNPGTYLAVMPSMLFRQLFDPTSSTYTYLLADPKTKQAVLIDPVKEQWSRDLQIVKELGLSLIATLDTHVHADHITASALLKTHAGSKIMVSKEGEVSGVDRELSHGDIIEMGEIKIEVRSTPGHTNCSLSYYVESANMVFTGDALLIRGCGRTDFQQGDPRKLYQSIHQQIFSLPDDTLIYPGHDYKGRTVTSVAEEKKYNARLSLDKSEEEFVTIMENLDLPRPKLIDIAVPGNKVSGYHENGGSEAFKEIVRGPSGIPEISVEWVQAQGNNYRIIDVREPEEFTGELSHIQGSELSPLGGIEEAASDWTRESPLVIVCRSGGRSGKAALKLEQMGFSQVVSIAGGMLRWNALGAAVA